MDGNQKNGHNPMPSSSLSQMLSNPYFVFNFMAFFSYIPLRCSTSHLLSPRLSSHLLHREIQATLAFSVLTVFKFVRQETWEAFIADMLFFAKIFLAGITFVVDYRLALWYVLVFLVTYILTTQPAYQGLGFATQLTPLQLEAVLTEGNTSRFWLVEFRSLSSSRCVQNSRHFPELSITYSNKNLSFGVVDLGLFPNTAEKFGLTLGGNEKLPMYILFENAVEVNRWPDVDFETRPYNLHLSKKLLCRHFELDLHLLDYINGK